MSDQHRAGRLDPRIAERLLDAAAANAAGNPAHHPADPGSGEPRPGGHEALHALLSAAAGPARPGELAGEDAAAAVFRAAAARSARRRSRRVALPRYVTVKVAVVAAALTAFGGGVALAASTGHLPGQSPSPAPSHHRAPSTSWNRDDRLTPSPSAVPRTTPGRRPKPSTSPKVTPGHGNTTAPGRTKSRTPKAKKTNPGRGNSNSNSENGNGNSGNGNSGDSGQSDHGHGHPSRGYPGLQRPVHHAEAHAT